MQDTVAPATSTSTDQRVVPIDNMDVELAINTTQYKSTDPYIDPKEI
jgi:hypothetical protein